MYITNVMAGDLKGHKLENLMWRYQSIRVLLGQFYQLKKMNLHNTCIYSEYSHIKTALLIKYFILQLVESKYYERPNRQS